MYGTHWVATHLSSHQCMQALVQSATGGISRWYQQPVVCASTHVFSKRCLQPPAYEAASVFRHNYMQPHLYSLVPLHLAHLFERWKARTPASTSSLTLRSTSTSFSHLPRPRTELFRRSPFYLLPFFLEFCSISAPFIPCCIEFFSLGF